MYRERLSFELIKTRKIYLDASKAVWDAPRIIVHILTKIGQVPVFLPFFPAKPQFYRVFFSYRCRYSYTVYPHPCSPLSSNWPICNTYRTLIQEEVHALFALFVQ